MRIYRCMGCTRFISLGPDKHCSHCGEMTSRILIVDLDDVQKLTEDYNNMYDNFVGCLTCVNKSDDCYVENVNTGDCEAWNPSGFRERFESICYKYENILDKIMVLEREISGRDCDIDNLEAKLSNCEKERDKLKVQLESARVESESIQDYIFSLLGRL